MLEKNNNWKLLELFFKKPLYHFHLRELCRLLNWSPTKVRAYTNELKKMNLITEKKEKNLSLFSSKRDSENFRKYKKIYNMLRAFEVGEIIEKSVEDFDAIIFFGSASKGEDIENSDFDICVVGSKDREINFDKIEKTMNRRVSLIFIPQLEMVKKENKELLNNLINGIVIKGYLKIF